MSALLYLTAADFDVEKENSALYMKNRIRGFSLILFYSTTCVHCKTLFPIFQRLPGSVNGCQFGMVNVSTERKCISMSKDTVAEIKYVPYIVMYVDGRPVMKYSGPYDINEIVRFIVEVSKRMKTQSFQTKAHGSNTKAIPEYSLGKPIKGNDDVCYLTNSTAYTDPSKN